MVAALQNKKDVYCRFHDKLSLRAGLPPIQAAGRHIRVRNAARAIIDGANKGTTPVWCVPSGECRAVAIAVTENARRLRRADERMRAGARPHVRRLLRKRLFMTSE
jgi:hypothetical protein